MGFNEDVCLFARKTFHCEMRHVFIDYQNKIQKNAFIQNNVVIFPDSGSALVSYGI